MLQLPLLAFMALKHPASLEQIIIYLLFLFPGFCAQHEALINVLSPGLKVTDDHGGNQYCRHHDGIQL